MAILVVYLVMFLMLGVLTLIATGPNMKPDEKLGMRKAYAKRARMRGHVKHRVMVDTRVKRHSKTGGYY